MDDRQITVDREEYQSLRDLTHRLQVTLGMVAAGLDAVLSASSVRQHYGPVVKVLGKRGEFESALDFGSRVNRLVDEGQLGTTRWHKRRELLLKGCRDHMIQHHPEDSLTQQLKECPEAAPATVFRKAG